MNQYESFSDDELINEFTTLREQQTQRINLAVTIRSENPSNPGAIKQAAEIQQDAISRYGPRINHLKKLLMQRSINPDLL